MLELELKTVFEIIGMLLTAGAIYGAIRMDIRNIHSKITDVKESTDEAHKRIDAILMKGSK